MLATINAIAPWYGSKRTLAPRIVTQLGEHSCYWEPFCGSMAVLLAKLQASAETVNDLHGDLVNLARVIQHPTLGPKLYRWLRRTWIAEAHFDAAKEVIQASETAGGEPDLERAYWYFSASWLGRNGTSGCANNNTHFCTRFTPGGGSAAARWRNAVDSIPSWWRRMRNVTILSQDGIELCERIADEAGTAIYADPPYLVKSEPYRHDLSDADHRRLAAALCRFKRARVVVSYYDAPQLGTLYPAWTRLKMDVLKLSAQANKRGVNGKTQAPEVLLINGPAIESGAARLF